MSGQPIFIPLGGGLDSGVDDKLLPVGKVPTLVNSFISRSGEVTKRGGLTALTNNTAPGVGVFDQAWQLATFKGSLVNLQVTHGPSPILVWSVSVAQWLRCSDPGVTSDAAFRSNLKGRVSHSLTPVTSDLALATNPDAAVSGGLYFSAYTGPDGHAVLKVIEISTGRIVYSWTTVGVGRFTKVIVTNGYAVLLYEDGGTHVIKADVWLIPTAFDSLAGPTTTTVATGTDAATFPPLAFDVINPPGVSTFCSIAYRTNANTIHRADFTPSSSGVVDVEIKTAAAASINATQAFGWISDLATSGFLGIITCTAAALQVQWNLTGGTPANTYTLNAAPGGDVRTVAGHTFGSSAAGDFQVIYAIYNVATPTYNRRIRTSVCNAGVVTDGEWIRSLGIVSKTFTYAGWFWGLVNYESGGSPSPLQSSVFMVRIPTDAVSNPHQNGPQARIALWNHAGNSTQTERSRVSSVAVVSSTTFAVAISVAVGSLNLTQGTGAGVSIAAITFDPILGPAREAADSLYVPGGVLGVFTGRSYEEDGFSIFPEQPATSTAAGGALTDNATYAYQIVYSFVDENGRKHRSKPCPSFSVSLNVTSRLTVDLATRSALPACTAVGSGIGKYLIETTPTGVGVTVDGTRVKEGQVVLVQNQATAADNGIYICTNAGLPPSAWQLSRSPLYDGSTGHVPLAGDIITSSGGVANAGKQFGIVGAGPFTVDVSALTFTPQALTKTINLAIPTLRLTNRSVTIEVYRTLANLVDGTKSLVGTIANDTTVDTVAFSDTFSDAVVALGEILYTALSLPSDPAPGFSFVFVAKNRLFGVSMDNPGEVWFSDEFVTGEAPRWNEERIITVFDDHGPVTAGAAIDDKVILFKGDAIYALNGDGPNELGQGAFTDVQLISNGVGLTNPQAIAATKDGILFGSSSTLSRIKMLDRSLSVQEIGGPVMEFDEWLLVAAGFMPSKDQARFYLARQIALVYDCASKQWLTYSFTDGSPAYSHATPWNGTYVTATTAPSVLVEDQSVSVFQDAGHNFPMSVTSPWVQLSGIKGFSRLKKIQGVGVGTRGVSVDVTLFLDFSRATVAGHYVGVPGLTWNWELIPRVQKGSAFQITIIESSNTPGVQISGVAMLIGTKGGLSRQSPGTRLVGQ